MKVTVLLMIPLGNSFENIAVSLGISIPTIQLYSQTYQDKGLDFYLENHYLGYRGKLNEEQKEVLKTELNTNLYATSQEIVDFIASKFGIQYTSTGLVFLLHRLGFSYKKTKLVPCEVNIEAQKDFCRAIKSLSFGGKTGR
ncbi:MAG: transposase [Saprospiraceae bacterium]|nr:transposase [Saprospiraceae bacterium]